MMETRENIKVEGPSIKNLQEYIKIEPESISSLKTRIKELEIDRIVKSQEIKIFERKILNVKSKAKETDDTKSNLLDDIAYDRLNGVAMKTDLGSTGMIMI
jgi:hypothetical protein